MSCSDKVMPDFFKPTFKKCHSIISRWGIFMQRRKLVTEGKGKETSAPARAKKGLEEAAWVNHKKGPTLFLPLPTSRHSWPCLRQHHWIHSALQHCIYSEKCTSTGQPPLKTAPLFLLKASLKSAYVTGCCLWVSYTCTLLIWKWMLLGGLFYLKYSFLTKCSSFLQQYHGNSFL